MANGYFSSSTGCVFLRNDNKAGGVAQLRLISLSGRSQIFSVPAGTQLILRDVLRLEELDVGGIKLSSLTVLDVPAGTDCAPATINTTPLPMTKKVRRVTGYSMPASKWYSETLSTDVNYAPVVDSISVVDHSSGTGAGIDQVQVSLMTGGWWIVSWYAVTAATNATVTIVYTLYPVVSS